MLCALTQKTANIVGSKYIFEAALPALANSVNTVKGISFGPVTIMKLTHMALGFGAIVPRAI